MFFEHFQVATREVQRLMDHMIGREISQRSEWMLVLGINNFANHDSSAAIVTDMKGKLEYLTISEERLSRVKRSHYSPIRSIKHCMDHFGVSSMRDFDLIVADWVFHKQLQQTARHYRNLEYDYIKTKLDVDYSRIKYIPSHHMAHAYSAFYPSHFEESAILVVDGFGSNAETNSLFRGDQEGIRLVEQAYGQGIGSVYELVTRDILGFQLGHEGKTMGLAAYGRNHGDRRLLNLNPHYEGMVTDFSHFVNRCPRASIKQVIPRCENKEDVTNDYYATIALELQEETERCLIHLANYAYEKTKSKRLCLAGGVALNCVANQKLVENTPFEEVFIQPASADDGLTLGLALYGYSQYRTPSIDFSVYSTRVYPRSESETLLEERNVPYKKASVDDVAELLNNDNIVSWFVGGSEVGPRALGHRSILANPRTAEMKNIINARIKHRETFRPFAPSVLEEDASQFFEMEGTSPYMLLAPRTRPERIRDIPAVVHVDGLARVQTVSRENQPYYDLLLAFKKKSGVGVLLNTSFNDNEEPIVETPMDALICFLRADIDYLYLDGTLIDKREILAQDHLLETLLVDRRRILDEQYEDAIETVTVGYSTDEMKRFMRSKKSTTDYYTSHYTFSRLREKVSENIDKYEYFVTDSFHKGVIEKHMPDVWGKISGKELIVVGDTMDALERLTKPSFILLYNASLYIGESNHYNFYEEREILRIEEPYEDSSLGDGVDFNCSNEFNLLKDWDEFYQTHIS